MLKQLVPFLSRNIAIDHCLSRFEKLTRSLIIARVFSRTFEVSSISGKAGFFGDILCSTLRWEHIELSVVSARLQENARADNTSELPQFQEGS